MRSGASRHRVTQAKISRNRTKVSVIPGQAESRRLGRGTTLFLKFEIRLYGSDLFENDEGQSDRQNMCRPSVLTKGAISSYQSRNGYTTHSSRPPWSVFVVTTIVRCNKQNATPVTVCANASIMHCGCVHVLTRKFSEPPSSEKI